MTEPVPAPAEMVLEATASTTDKGGGLHEYITDWFDGLAIRGIALSVLVSAESHLCIEQAITVDPDPDPVPVHWMDLSVTTAAATPGGAEYVWMGQTYIGARFYRVHLYGDQPADLVIGIRAITDMRNL